MLCSEATIAAAGGAPDGVGVKDLGEHRLKDLSRPMRLFQATPAGLPRELPPPRTLDADRTNLPALANALIGREAELGPVRERLAMRDVRLITLTGPAARARREPRSTRRRKPRTCSRVGLTSRSWPASGT